MDDTGDGAVDIGTGEDANDVAGGCETGGYDSCEGLDFTSIDDAGEAGADFGTDADYAFEDVGFGIGDSQFETGFGEELDSLNAWMCEHDYGAEDYGEYSQSPEWAELHESAYPEKHEQNSVEQDVWERLDIVSEINEYEDLMSGINPGFDPYVDAPQNTNCGACALALEGRLSGNDPEAIAGLKNVGTIEEMNSLTGLTQTPTSPEEIKAYAEAMGPGYNAIVGFDRPDQEGHWFNVAVSESGRVYALDSQCGMAAPFDEYIDAYADDGINFDIYR